MEFKVKIFPEYGSISDTKNIKFQFLNISKGSKIEIENATHSLKVEEFEVLGNTKKLEKVVDLKIPEHSSDSLISIFVSLKENNILKSIVPIVFKFEEEKGAKEKFYVYPSVVDKNNLFSVFFKANPFEKIILSINDKRYNAIANDKGIGSIKIKSYDFIGDIFALKKIPIYFYDSSDGYVKKNFSGVYVSIIPQEIKTLATVEDARCDDYDPLTWSPPSWCLVNNLPETPIYYIPKTPSTELPVKTCSTEGDCTYKNNEITISDDCCKIHDVSYILLPNGMILYSYVSIDKSYTDGEDEYNKTRVFISSWESSLDANVIVAKEIAVEAKNAEDDFTFYVDQNTYERITELDSSGKTAVVVLFDENFDYQAFPISSFEQDEYTLLYKIYASRTTTSISVDELMPCVYAVFYEQEDGDYVAPEIDIINKLPFIEYNSSEYVPKVLSISKANIGCNSNYVGEEGESYIYVLAEALLNKSVQLFLYIFTVGPDGHTSQNTDDWILLTSTGNNKNAKLLVDNFNNLHVFWESDRTGYSQIYYGVIGPSSVSLGNSMLSSILDKQADIIKNSTESFAYLSNNLLVQNSSSLVNVEDSLTDEGDYCLVSDTGILTNLWIKNITGNGAVEANNETIEIDADTFDDTAMAFMPVNEERLFAINEGKNSQTNYQISFDVDADILQDKEDFTTISSYSNLSVDNLFETWKSKFTLEENVDENSVPIYSYQNNKFYLGKEEQIRDKIIPIVGSYKNEDLDGEISGDILTSDFVVNVSGVNRNINHFVIGIIPEKVKFKSTNIEDEQERADRLGISLTEGSYTYSEGEFQEIYTGKASLAIVYGKDERLHDFEIPHSVIKVITDSFNFFEANNIKILVNYSKLYNEDIIQNLSISENQVDDFPRYMCNIYVLINNQINFSESFLVNLSDAYREFDIGFGVPSKGYFVSDKFYPYSASIFEKCNIVLNYTNVQISSPTYLIDSDIAVVPTYIKDQENFGRYDYYGDTESTTRNFFDNFNLFFERTNTVSSPSFLTYFYESGDVSGCDNHKIDRSRQADFSLNQFMQIPITLEGVNTNISAKLGFTNDVHIVWQSNRFKDWEIFYSNSTDKNLPFRFDTRITNSDGNSLKPDISVDRKGNRLAVWHDDRNGSYQVFSGKTTKSLVTGESLCERNGLIKYFDENSVDFNKISFEFTNTCDSDNKYHFVLKFYSDEDKTKLIAVVSSFDSVVGWKVNGEKLTSTGVDGTDLMSIEYTPDITSNICGKLLYVKIIPIKVG